MKLKEEYKISYYDNILKLISDIHCDKLSKNDIINRLRDISRGVKYLEEKVKDDDLILKIWGHENDKYNNRRNEEGKTEMVSKNKKI